jgi:multidrug efflux pump subunit AcrB
LESAIILFIIYLREKYMTEKIKEVFKKLIVSIIFLAIFVAIIFCGSCTAIFIAGAILG